MKMMNELKHMMLYSSKKKVYAPIDEKDRRKNSAILLLTPNLEESSKLMKLPYIYNPNLFQSFYVDRNVMAYIDNVKEKDLDIEDFDEVEEENISEAMYGNWTNKCRIGFDEDKTTIMDMRYIRDVYTPSYISHICKILGLRKVPETINIETYINTKQLRLNAPKEYSNVLGNRLFGYSIDNTIHVLSKYYWDPEYNCGDYDLYLKAELINCIVKMISPGMSVLCSKAVAYALSGLEGWVSDSKNTCYIDRNGKEWRFAHTINNFIKVEGYKDIQKFIKTGDMSIFTRFGMKSMFADITQKIFDEAMTTEERNNLKDSDFGIPDKRKYPLNDEIHVRSAIKMFNYCEKDDEKELAKNIIKKMKNFNIDNIKVGSNNRFSKYYSLNESVDEYIMDDSIKTDSDLLKWMNNNIKYCNFTTLKTPKEIYETKRGSCHDQVLYELTVLRKLGYRNVKAWFFLEYNDNGQGGETHSIVTYEKNRNCFYFENAWELNKGIHKIPNEKNNVLNLFTEFHDKGKIGNINKYNNISVCHFYPEPGITLQEILDNNKYTVDVNESTTILNELASIPDNKIVVGTDFHFVGYDDNQKNIILKPASYINKIIKKQNELTGNDGVFIFLGDLLYKGFHNEYEIPSETKDQAIKYIKKFKGKYKILIRGNHDNLPDEFYLDTLGFTHICSSLTYGNIVFSHQPEVVNNPMINIHGHIHGARKYVEPKPKNHVDVYAVGGKDLRMSTLPEILDAKEEYEKTIKQGTNIKNLDPHLFIPGERMNLDDIVSESAVDDNNYSDILHICNNLSEEELRRITFYDTYRNSKYVIKRIIARSNEKEPIGFLDVYQYPSNPSIAQIVLAVDDKYHGNGIGTAMVKEMLDCNLQNEFKFNMYYWTVNPGNDASANLALKMGFTNTEKDDSYGRRIFILPFVDRNKDNIWEEISNNLSIPDSNNSIITESGDFITDGLAIFSETNNEKQYSRNLRRYLYQERLKNNKAVLNIYEKIKSTNPNIKKTYPKLKMYKKFNIWVDLSYYHALFLEKNIYKLDRAINFYFNFLNRLINNPEINSEYKKRTILIPVDNGVWPISMGSDITDWKKNLNPISIIFRLIRTNLAGLRKEWGNKDIIFVGSRGYFKIDFNKLEIKNLSRLKTNLRKLMSSDEIIEDEEDIDELEADDNDSKKNVDSKVAMAVKMIDKIESKSSVKFDDISAVNKQIGINVPELSIQSTRLKINNTNNQSIVLAIEPDESNKIDITSNILKDLEDLTIYNT